MLAIYTRRGSVTEWKWSGSAGRARARAEWLAQDLTVLTQEFYRMADAASITAEAFDGLTTALGSITRGIYWDSIPRRIAWWFVGTIAVVTLGCALGYAMEHDAGLLETLRHAAEWGAR